MKITGDHREAEIVQLTSANEGWHAAYKFPGEDQIVIKEVACWVLLRARLKNQTVPVTGVQGVVRAEADFNDTGMVLAEQYDGFIRYMPPGMTVVDLINECNS